MKTWAKYISVWMATALGAWTTTAAQDPGCIEIEAILINSCPGPTGANLPEGLNEMVFMRVGANPIDLTDAYLNQTSIIGFPDNTGLPNALSSLTPPTASTTSIIGQWRQSLLYPECADLIEVSAQLAPPYVLPAGARVILVTSALFSAEALDFSELLDTVYFVYASNTNTTGRFANQPNQNEVNSGNHYFRNFRFCPFPDCCDTASYLPLSLAGQNGETVFFDWDGNPTPALLNCKPPVPTSVPNVLSALVGACEGTAVLRGSNVAPYVGQWFVVSVPEGANEPVFSPDPDSARVTIQITVPGTYRFGRRLFLPGACPSLIENSTRFIDLTFPEHPTAEWAPFSTFVCPGETAVLAPAEPGEVEWFLNGESLGTAPEWETDVPGSYRFSRTLDGCVAESEERVLTVGFLPDAPEISVSPAAPCPGETVVFSANVSVQWFFNNVEVATGTEYAFVHDATTAGAYFARVGNECGFADSDVVITTLPLPLPQNLGIGANVENFCTSGALVSVVNYAPGFQYRWFGPTNFANPGGPSQTVSAFGEYGFWASNGCDSLEFRITVSESDLPVLGVSVSPATADICPGGGSATFSAAAVGAQEPVEYLWERNGTAVVGDGATLTVSDGGSYRVSVRDACGRRGAATAQANLLPGAKMNPEGRQTICLGETATVQLSGAQSYSWLPAPGLTAFDDGATALLSPIDDQTYQCVCTYGACVETLSVDVFVVLPPQLTLESEKSELEQGDSTVLRARSNAVVYRWRPSSSLSDSTASAVIATPAATTVYTVTAVNANGCSTTDTIGVRVKPKRKLHAGLPNVFTPNGDGINDVFPFSIPEGYSEIEVSVFGRWGQRLFLQKSDLSRGNGVEWNGKHPNGADCPEGVYFYSVSYSARGKELQRTGSITLIR